MLYGLAGHVVGATQTTGVSGELYHDDDHYGWHLPIPLPGPQLCKCVDGLRGRAGWRGQWHRPHFVQYGPHCRANCPEVHHPGTNTPSGKPVHQHSVNHEAGLYQQQTDAGSYEGKHHGTPRIAYLESPVRITLIRE